MIPTDWLGRTVLDEPDQLIDSLPACRIVVVERSADGHGLEVGPVPCAVLQGVRETDIALGFQNAVFEDDDALA